MSRTLIDIDDDALSRAMTALGTKTKVDTVNAALRQIGARPLQQQLLTDLDDSDLDDAEIMGGAWR